MIARARQQAELFGKLADIGGLLKLQTAIVWLLRAASLGLAADCGLLIVARYRAFTAQAWLLAAIPLALAGASALVCLSRRHAPAAVAMRADHTLSLKERITTALELQSPANRLGGVLAEAQLADAMWHVRRIEPWRSFSPRVPGREGLLMAAAVLATMALIVLPNPGKQAIEQQAAVAATIRQQAQKLNKTAVQIQRNAQLTGNQSQDQRTIEQILADLQKQLRQPSLTADQALAKLQSAQQKLQANQDPNADQLAEALQTLAAEFDNQPLLRKVAQDVRSGNYNAAAKDLQSAGQQAASLSPGQKSTLAASLRAAAAAEAKAANSQLSDALNQAADSLHGQPADTSRAFRRASDSLRQSGQRSQAQQNLSNALGQVQQSANTIAQQSGGSAASGNTSSSLSPSSSSGSQRSPNGLSQGQGTAPGQAGQPGSSAQGQGQGQGQGQRAGGQGRGASGGQQGETVYTGQPSTAVGVPGQQGSTGKVATSNANGVSNPVNNGSNVPYQQVVGQYQKQATQAMDRQSVPLSYREIVKDYFSSLAPQR